MDLTYYLDVTVTVTGIEFIILRKEVRKNEIWILCYYLDNNLVIEG